MTKKKQEWKASWLLLDFNFAKLNHENYFLPESIPSCFVPKACNTPQNVDGENFVLVQMLIQNNLETFEIAQN